MSPGRTDPTGEDGSTLAELLTALAVLGLVLAGIGTLHGAAQRAYLAGATKTAVDQSARIALERLASEIRQATLGCAGTAASATAFTFCDTPATAVTYTLTAGALTRNGVVVVGGVGSLSFVYRDAGDAQLASPVATPASIRRVDITIQTRSEDPLIAGSAGASDARAQVTTSARLRNL